MSRLLSVVLALALVALTASAALAEEQTVTVTTKVKIPLYDKTAIGTVVMHNTGTPDNIAVNWSYTGQLDGKSAKASGKALASWDGHNYSGHVTQITAWNMPGIPKPGIGATFRIEDQGNHVVNVYFDGLVTKNLYTKLVYQGIDAIPEPFTGDIAISVTNTTASGIDELPKTGSVPQAAFFLPLALVGLGGALVLISRRGLSAATKRG